MKMDSGVRKWDERMKSQMSQKHTEDNDMKPAREDRSAFQLPSETGNALRKSAAKHGMTIMGFHQKCVEVGMKVLDARLASVMDDANRIIDQASGNTGPAKK